MAYFISTDGARLYYDDRGDGLPLLCLAGLTRTAEDFDYLLPYLPPARVIRMDYRGRGRSQFTGSDTYTVPREAADAIDLLDHLGIARAAILGTSRGGLIGMFLGQIAKERLLGLCLNDVGPVIARAGLERIFGYVGRNPRAETYDELAVMLPGLMQGFANVPPSRWQAEVRHHYNETETGLQIRYDPGLRQAFLAAFDGPEPDLWPLFDGLTPLPLALIRGANSDLLSSATAAEMRRRRPDMIFTEVPGRGHVPFLDEPEAVAVVRAFLAAADRAPT